MHQSHSSMAWFSWACGVWATLTLSLGRVSDGSSLREDGALTKWMLCSSSFFASFCAFTLPLSNLTFFFHFVQWELQSLPHKIKHWEKEGYSYLFSMYLEILCVLVLSIILMAFRVFSARFLSYLSGLLRFLSNSKVESCRYAKTRNNYVNRLKHKLWK